jgi:alpha-L-fucosidase
VSRGGNLLLNVGPTADGRIPVIMQERLVDIGRWLEVNGEGIFGTKPWEKAGINRRSDKSLFFTKKGEDLFVICTRWPGREIEIKGLDEAAKTEVRLLGYDGNVAWRKTEDGLSIQPPAVSPATFPCNYAWIFKIFSRSSR